jgi:hypothetical protein
MRLKVYFATLPHSAEAHPTLHHLPLGIVYGIPATIGCVIFQISIDIIGPVIVTLKRRHRPSASCTDIVKANRFCQISGQLARKGVDG